jgi:hypothetical protein
MMPEHAGAPFALVRSADLYYTVAHGKHELLHSGVHPKLAEHAHALVGERADADVEAIVDLSVAQT